MKRNEIVFIDTSHEVKQAMTKLSKDALRKSGRVITKILRKQVPKKTGALRKSVTAWVRIDRRTGRPFMSVGYRSRGQMRKRGVKFFVNPIWFEFGTKPHAIMTKEFKANGSSSYQLQKGNQKFGVFVNHPGMRGRNLLRNTVISNLKEIKSAQEDYLSELTDMMIKSGAKFNVGGDEEVD